MNWATGRQNQQSDCAPSEDSDQPGHPPSLIRVFAVHMKKAWVLSYPLSAQRRLWSDWAEAQADLSLRWAHSHFVGFVMSWLNYFQIVWPWLMLFQAVILSNVRIHVTRLVEEQTLAEPRNNPKVIWCFSQIEHAFSLLEKGLHAYQNSSTQCRQSKYPQLLYTCQ